MSRHAPMYSSYKSEKTFVKQADSAQNKRTVNEAESFKLNGCFKLRMACSSIVRRDPFFQRTPGVGWQAQQPSANITAFPQREFGKTKSVNWSFQQEWLIWYEIPASASRLKQSLPHWLFIDHHKGRIQNHLKLRQNKINTHKHIQHTSQVLWLSKVKKLKPHET